MALTADQLNTIYNNVLFRNVDAGGIQFFANRTDISDAQVRQQIELSPESTTYVSPIVRLYQAEFGRVPDVGGLKFFVQSYEQGGGTQNISVIAQQLLSSAEASTASGTVAGNTLNAGFVSTIYNNILGRTASTGEVGFWTGSGKTAAVVLSEITNSNESAQRNAAGTVTFLDSAATGQANSGSLNAQTTSGGGTVGGQSFAFAASTPFETLTGTGGSDTFNGIAANVESTDTVNGGAGTDVVQIFNAIAAQGIPTLNSVEQLLFVAPAAALTNADLSNVTGLQNVNLKNSAFGATFALKTGVAVGLDAVSAGNVIINTGADATSQTVFLANGTTAGTVTVANRSNGTALTSVTLDSALATANSIAAIDVTANSKTLNITGAQKLTITGALDTDITTVNASANTGGVTILASATNLTATGGSGNDKFAFANNLDTNDTVVGGAGTDTIAITGVDLTNPANVVQLNALNTKVTGVEVLEFTGAVATTIQGGTGTGAFTNTEITKLLFNTDAADTINQAGSTRTYAFGELNTGNATINLSAGSTSANVSLEAIADTNPAGNTGGDIGTLTVALDANVVVGTTSTVNIASIGPGTVANTITAVAAVAGSTINITGSHELTVAGLTNGGTVNASTFTGKLTLTGSGANDAITVGSGGSVIDGGAGIDTITVSGGTNTITGGSGADIVTAGSGIDTFAFSGVTGANSSGTTFGQADVINSFAVGTDKLQFTTVSDVVSGQQAGVQTAVTALAAGSTDIQIATAMATANTTSLGVSFAVFNGNTYALYETTGGGVGVAADDVFIKLVGVSSGVTFANSVVA